MSLTHSHQDLQSIIKTALAQCESATNINSLTRRRDSVNSNNHNYVNIHSVKKLNLEITHSYPL